MKRYVITSLMLAFIMYLSIHDISMGITLSEVHSWPDSRCDLCHLSSAPEAPAPLLTGEDRSRLCESCHSGSLTVPAHSSSGLPMILKNHPVQFSPLDFDAERINQNIIQRNGNYYVSGPGGNVRLFGSSPETAVIECSSCHDPHGKSGLPLLQYTGNPKDDLCLVCHKIKNTMIKNTM